MNILGQGGIYIYDLAFRITANHNIRRVLDKCPIGCLFFLQTVPQCRDSRKHRLELRYFLQVNGVVLSGDFICQLSHSLGEAVEYPFQNHHQDQPSSSQDAEDIEPGLINSTVHIGHRET